MFVAAAAVIAIVIAAVHAAGAQDRSGTREVASPRPSQGAATVPARPAVPRPKPASDRRPRVHPTAPQLPLPRSDGRLLGQRIVVGMPGTTADSVLLAQVRDGHVGGVILFARNIASSSQVKALVGSLQQAAREGGNPPLLIAVDQEGGSVTRIPLAPPSLSPPQMVATHNPHVAFRQGQATGRYLRSLGINMDLAPVLDVPTSTSSFMFDQGRTFSFDPRVVARFATQFMLGLQSAGVAATGKHFPGLGAADTDTDDADVRLDPTSGQRAAALFPYRALIARGLDAVMVSLAAFAPYDRSGAPASLSAPIIDGLLRHQLGFTGVTITDSLASPTGHDEITAGLLAAKAGADLLLYVDSAPGELYTLARALSAGRLDRAQADASYRQIVALKERLQHG